MKLYTSFEDLPKSCYECPCRNCENGRCQIENEITSQELRPAICPIKTLDIFSNADLPGEVDTTQSISTLELSPREHNILTRAGVLTTGKLWGLSLYELTHMRNLGRKSFAAIIEKLWGAN